MKVSLNWIKEFVDLNGISNDEIVSCLTMCGLEVEDVMNQNEIYKGFIVGKVLEKKKHPNADKLSVCYVSTGTETLQVVCGAPNVDVNQKIIFAPVGTTIPNNKMVLSKIKIRSVESNGMICSEKELNIGDDEAGIKILDEELKEGTSITEALGLNNLILEIAITPNRPDALSHLGIARDLSALFNRKLNIPEIKTKSSSKKIDDYAKVEIEDIENCPRYSAKVVLNVEVKESPDWLKKKIESIGLRSINNIVDVTNFILNEIGQPLHAFDLDKLNGRKIIVKKAKANSFFNTLDSKRRKLNENILMICDEEKDIAIAGVMGGENSEVTFQTKNILIESAYFNPSSIRKTSKFLGLSTDASYRFERGCNYQITDYTAERASELIAEIAGGEICEGIIDVYPNPVSVKNIELRLNQVKRILGYEIELENTKQILINLGFEIIKSTDGKLLLTIPSFRPDIEREIDIIEEIARIYGYDNIPTVTKINSTLDEKIDESEFTNKIRNILISAGCYEIYCNSLQNEKIANYSGKSISVLNPQSLDMSNLRTDLIMGGLDVVKRNINANEKNIKIFEIGKVFNKLNDELNSFDDFTEEEKLLILISGKDSEKEWLNQSRTFDFYDLKGIVNTLLMKINLDIELQDSYYNNGNNFFEYYFAKMFNNNVIGSGGKLNKELLNIFDIQQEVFCFELNIDELKKIEIKDQKFSELLRFPKINRDFAFVFDKELKFETINSFINKNKSKLLKNIKVFDIFESEILGTDKKSVAFGLEYYDNERTLTEVEVEKDFQILIEKIKKEFNAVLRGN